MFLPDPRRRGEIHFVLARSMPYSRRLAMIGVLLGLGFALQLIVHVYAGAVLLLAASLLGVVKGYSNIPEVEGGGREWRGTQREHLFKVLHLSRRIRQWDRSALDVTCATGQVVFVLVGAAVTGAYILLEESGYRWLGEALAIDAAVLLGPHWITGVRRILTNDPLVVKIEELLAIESYWESIRQAGEVMLTQMQVRSTSKGEMPCDAKLVLRIEPLGDAFLGVQVQVVLNNVQGKDYPYLYCVLVARPQLGMLGRLERVRPPRNIVVEPKCEPADDVDILVVRQMTTRTSGYHTRDSACREIFTFALGLARRLAATPARASRA